MSTVRVEVVHALPDRQWTATLELSEGATVADALTVVSSRDGFSGIDLDRAAVGVWGQVVERQRRLAEGDRVEIYRPLLVDPMEARRRREAAAVRARSRS